MDVARSHSKIVFVIFILIYRMLLDILYVQTIAPFWGYYGFINDPSHLCKILSWIILAAFIVIVFPYLKSDEEFSSDIALIIFFLKIVPFTSFIACKQQPIDFILCEVLYLFLIYLFLKTIHVPKLSNKFKSTTLTNLIVAVLIVTVFFISAYYANFRLSFNFIDVYEIRFEARDYDMPTILKYLRGASSNILPVALAYALSRKKYAFSILLVFVIFLSFSTNGMKSTLFKMIICIFLFLLYKVDFKKYLGIAFLSLAVLSLLEWIALGTNVLSTVIVRRVLMIPQVLDSFYYDFTLNNGPLYYGGYHGEDVSFAIGAQYWSNGEIRANNGFFSDFYINIGFIGCIIYPLLYVIFFKYCEAAFGKSNRQIVMFVAIIVIYTLMGSSFTTSLLTHGLFLLLVTMYVTPWENNKEQ
ncbi:hypothetical protein NXV78_20660 [Bacteroides cellulosilyticus]|jgi:membrane protein|uniref:O-antigen ligase domain-containing protein n=2 Tax=Bacteroides cellulosilyticus TaxID=246787 RepID=A0AAW6M2F8_9BACE|nr:MULTISPECIES: hypothetical protein [Bacteroides]KAA5419289.1 hypothetical protein F2Y70_23580 [Bacteroides cellulosilyticus]KAA5435456.1 hypothetical protein F2Y83_12490 [Bacteroides cellulosilyticus]KAA5461515.1 hypothetical protein F2Y53_06100 [Bacteroides cellulosilyticus]MCQ4946389.1 hypothetical protein [Bacteroides cellulosilyticus]MCS3056424.1 hypothetical protein [Bacteroides cellulosilyticus]